MKLKAYKNVLKVDTVKKLLFTQETGKVIVEDGQLITLDTAKEIEAAGIESVVIRSAFTCNSRHGVCEKCYGKNLATGEKVEVADLNNVSEDEKK